MSLNFILPTQAAGAIMIDGTAIIVVGAIVVAYYLYKYATGKSRSPIGTYVTNANNNVLENRIKQKEADFLRPQANSNTNENVNKQTQIKVEEHIQQEKEVIMNKNY